MAYRQKNNLSLDQAIADKGSTFHVLKEMLKIRKDNSALQRGDFRRILIDIRMLCF